MNKDTGGPAFPTPAHNLQNDGMTLRDYFAAKAMQIVLYQCDCFPDTDWRDGVAMDAYKMADAMLKARGRA
jgi:hypothetical protein